MECSTIGARDHHRRLDSPTPRDAACSYDFCGPISARTRNPIALLVLLQLLQTCATLYLPTLNADIIDNGVVKGDTGYILRFGGVMLGVTLVQVVCTIGAVYFGARTAIGARPGHAGGRLRPGAVLLRPRGRPVRRAVADHPDHQRRAAGPDAGR